MSEVNNNLPETDGVLDELRDLGDRFIALGETLKRKDSTLSDLTDKAFECGLIFQFRITPQETLEIDVAETNDGY